MPSDSEKIASTSRWAARDTCPTQRAMPRYAIRGRCAPHIRLASRDQHCAEHAERVHQADGLPRLRDQWPRILAIQPPPPAKLHDEIRRCGGVGPTKRLQPVVELPHAHGVK